MDFLRRNPLIAGLAALCVALAAVVAVELLAVRTPVSPTAPRKAAPAEAKLLPQVAAVSPESAYTETAARPLWIPTRRPAPPVAAVAAQTFTRGQFILQGVTIAGNTRIAMLKEKSSGRIHRVELGRDVNGLHMAEIEPDRVTLSQGAEREVVELRVQRGAAVASAPGAPGAPPAAPTPPHSAAVAAGAPAPATGPFVPPPTSPSPGGVPLIPPGPMPPSARPPAAVANPAVANPAPGAVPQQSAAPMTPEELLARRRARRNQPTE